MPDKISREKLKEMVNDEDQFEDFKSYLADNHSQSDMATLIEIFRELRMEELFNDLGIDAEKLDKAKRKVIKLGPKSKEWPLMSTLYKDHNGLYKVEDLFNEYHDDTFNEGYHIGFCYGTKFFIEDLKNGRFTKEDILKMSEEEINKYRCEEREEI